MPPIITSLDKVYHRHVIELLISFDVDRPSCYIIPVNPAWNGIEASIEFKNQTASKLLGGRNESFY